MTAALSSKEPLEGDAVRLWREMLAEAPDGVSTPDVAGVSVPLLGWGAT